VFSFAPARQGAELPAPKPCTFQPKGTSSPQTFLFLTEGLEYFTVIVEIPTVCDATAAGLGVRGVVTCAMLWLIANANNHVNEINFNWGFINNLFRTIYYEDFDRRMTNKKLITEKYPSVR